MKPLCLLERLKAEAITDNTLQP